MSHGVLSKIVRLVKTSMVPCGSPRKSYFKIYFKFKTAISAHGKCDISAILRMPNRRVKRMKIWEHIC